MRPPVEGQRWDFDAPIGAWRTIATYVHDKDCDQAATEWRRKLPDQYGVTLTPEQMLRTVQCVQRDAR